MNKLSSVFRPSKLNVTFAPNTLSLSKSHTLLDRLGLVHNAGHGFFQLLPMAQRSIEKLIRLVDYYMAFAGAQKITMPCLTPKFIWEQAGSLQHAGKEIFRVTDRTSKEYILSPTHEEAISKLLATEPTSFRHFPLLLYQITSKFRDEKQPRLGLIRSREFLMKDLYSFDTTMESARITYNNVTKIYNEIFNALDISFIRAEATLNDPKLHESHEFHYACDIGDDKILRCPQCKFAKNLQVERLENCPKCSAKLEEILGIEVGHTFLFGTWYSNPLGTNYITPECKKDPLYLCSYGIGITRLIAASLECLSTKAELRWPLVIAPYTVCIIPPKDGSKENLKTGSLLPDIYKKLTNIPQLKNDVIVDDRTRETIGRRFVEDKCLGFPFIIVLGRSTTEQVALYEFHDLSTNEVLYLAESELIRTIADKTKKLRAFAEDSTNHLLDPSTCNFGGHPGLLRRQQQRRTFFSFPGGKAFNTKEEYNAKKLVGYSPQQMYNIVSDVGNYKHFLPFCKKSDILMKNDDEHLKASLEIGFPPLVESYISHITMKRNEIVTAESSNCKIFDRLVTIWKFEEGLKDMNNTSVVSFYLCFQFKSIIHAKMVHLVFNELVHTMENAFLKEARRRHGRPSIKTQTLVISKT